MPALTDNLVISRIASKLNQCPVPVIVQQLRDVVQDFYDRTKLWRVTLGPVDTLANDPLVTLPIPVGALLVQAHEVRLNKIQLAEKSEEALDLSWSDMTHSFSFDNSRTYHFGGRDEPT